jgi:hypothetical protein
LLPNPIRAFNPAGWWSSPGGPRASANAVLHAREHAIRTTPATSVNAIDHELFGFSENWFGSQGSNLIDLNYTETPQFVTNGLHLFVEIASLWI